MPYAIVAGAGPVGALSAIFLAQQGFTVEVFEKRPHPEPMPAPDDSKAYLLNLNERAFNAFHKAGVNTDILVERCNGKSEFVMRDKKGRYIVNRSMPVTKENPTSMRVYRDELSRHLIDEACRLHPQAITFNFSTPLTSIDFQAQVATFASPLREIHYELLVGADGAGSVVRSQLQKVLPPGFVKRRENSAVYATGPMDIRDAESFPNSTFTTIDSFSEGAVMCYGRGNGPYRIGLFLDLAGAGRLHRGEKAWLHEHLKSSMPQLKADARRAAAKLADAAPEFSSISGWTYCSQLHGPKVVLLGDAAHTMTPVLGQGCNSGLEDASIFADILSGSQNIDAALQRYTIERLPDVTAVVQLNEIAANGRFRNVLLTGATGETSQETISHRIWLSASGLAMAVHMSRMALHMAVPSVFPVPTMIRVMGGSLPYRRVMPAAYLDMAAVLLTACGIAAVLCQKYWKQ